MSEVKQIREITVRVDEDVLLRAMLETIEPDTLERWSAVTGDRIETLTIAQGRMVSGFLQILVGALPDPQQTDDKKFATAFKSSADKARMQLVAEMRNEIDEQWQAIDNARKVLEEALWNAGVKPSAGRGLVECAELAAARVQRLPEDDAQG